MSIPAQLSSLECTQAELAEFLATSDRHLRNLKKVVPPVRKDGTRIIYNLRDATQAFIAYQAQVSGTEGGFTAAEMEQAKRREIIAKAKKEEALARIAEVDASKAEGSVAQIEDVRQFVTLSNERVTAKLYGGIPGCAQRMVGLDDPEEAKAMLLAFVKNACMELADWPMTDMAPSALEGEEE